MALTGFDMSLLRQKYAAMNLGAQADMKRADAALLSAQNAGARGSSLDSTPFDPTAAAREALLAAQTRQANAATAATVNQSALAEDENRRQELINDQLFNSNTLTEDQAKKLIDALRGQTPGTLPAANKKGLAKVPKTGKTTVHKGEAILNKEAAKNLGRGLIAAMNVKGQQKMGMV